MACPSADLPSHALHLAEDEQGFPDPDPLGIAEQHAEGEHIGRVADVDCDGYAVGTEQRDTPPTEL
jgi:hypothetical protein